MSEKQLVAFLEAVRVDAGLQEQLMAAGDADAVLAVAKAAGFVISAEELRAAEAEAAAEAAELMTQLDEELLEDVAGGRFGDRFAKWGQAHPGQAALVAGGGVVGSLGLGWLLAGYATLGVIK